MPFCANCGASIADDHRFCTHCGTQRIAPMAEQRQFAVQPPYIPPVAYQSRVIAVLAEAKMITPMGATDIYTIAFTPSQAIMAKLTGEVLTDFRKKVQAQGKAEGKGWLGRAGDQMRALGSAHLRYLEMTPEQILAETPGNFVIDHATVATVSIRLINEPISDDGSGDSYVEVVFNTSGGWFKYHVSMRIKEVVKIIGSIYPGRVTEKK